MNTRDYSWCTTCGCIPASYSRSHIFVIIQMFDLFSPTLYTRHWYASGPHLNGYITHCTSHAHKPASLFSWYCFAWMHLKFGTVPTGLQLLLLLLVPRIFLAWPGLVLPSSCICCPVRCIVHWTVNRLHCRLAVGKTSRTILSPTTRTRANSSQPNQERDFLIRVLAAWASYYVAAVDTYYYSTLFLVLVAIKQEFK